MTFDDDQVLRVHSSTKDSSLLGEVHLDLLQRREDHLNPCTLPFNPDINQCACIRGRGMPSWQ